MPEKYLFLKKNPKYAIKKYLFDILEN